MESPSCDQFFLLAFAKETDTPTDDTEVSPLKTCRSRSRDYSGCIVFVKIMCYRNKAVDDCKPDPHAWKRFFSTVGSDRFQTLLRANTIFRYRPTYVQS